MNNNLEKNNISNINNKADNQNNFHPKEESIVNRRKAIMEDVLELLKFNKTYEERIKDIKDYTAKNKSYKTLNLIVASTSLKFSKNIFSITPRGMSGQEMRMGGGDGIVLFGYEPVDNIEQEFLEENFDQRMSVYDFSFPTEKENSINLNEFPSFTIYFDTKTENYYIKDFNIGIGALMKVKKYKIENNTLINVGANYLVISIEKEFLIVKIFNNSILENNNNHNKKFILKRFKIDKKDFALTIGRNKKCDISIDDMMMSKVQSTIKYNSKEKNFYLFDGNSQKESMNGTWVYILNPVLITDNFVFKAEHTLFVINVNNNKN